MNTSQNKMAFRPDSYWPDSLTPDQLFTRIRGKERQDIARMLYKQQGFKALNQFLVREGLDEPDRVAWGLQGPWCMGGEYLPELLEGEVEIARISMKSTTSDQISVRALQEGDRIRYRIVGEYEDDDMSYMLPFDSSELPLTINELFELIDGAEQEGDCYPGGILTSSWNMVAESSNEAEEIMDFLSLSSAFYPDINEYYMALAYDWSEERSELDEEAEPELPSPAEEWARRAVWERRKFGGGGAQWAAIVESLRANAAIRFYTDRFLLKHGELPKGNHSVIVSFGSPDDGADCRPPSNASQPAVFQREVKFPEE